MNIGIDENTILGWIRFQLKIFEISFSNFIVLSFNTTLTHTSGSELQPCE